MSFAEDVVTIANHEWDFFGRDQGSASHKVDGSPKETVGNFAQRVGDYWLSIDSADYKKLVKEHAKTLGKLDGTITELPWSAAFISYCMQMAGAGSQFPYSAGHATWIIKAIANRTVGNEKAALVGYRVNEHPLLPGDLVGAPRGDDADVTYDQAVGKGWFSSHTDLIVEVDKASRKAFAIGGNVGQSVSRTTLRIDSEGRLTDTSRPWIVHIRNGIKTAPLVASAGKTLASLLKVG